MAAIRNGRSGKSFTAIAKALAIMNGAGFGIETSQHTEINAAINIFSDGNRRLHVVALLVMRPENRGIGIANLWRCNVPFCVEPDCAHRAGLAMAAGEVRQVIGHNRRGHRDIAAIIQMPDFFAAGQLVSGGVMPAIDKDLSLTTRLCERGSAPGGHIIARRSPELFSTQQVKNREEGVRLHVTKNHDFVPINDGRTGKSPLRTAHGVIARVHRTEVLFPHGFAIHVETKQTLGAEDRHEEPAISCGSRTAMATLRMAFYARYRCMAELIPDDFAIGLVEGQQSPFLRANIRGRFDVPIKPHLQISFAWEDG